MFRSPLADGLVVLVLVLLVLGPKRLPMLSRSVGESIREFKGGIAERNDDKHLDASKSSAHSVETSEQRDTVA
jgi:sec-independent protein translocase protein TatA